jgi:cAMP-dependent protein kinase regulator
MYNAPRAASCIAKGDVTLWALDRASFNVILMKTAMSNRKKMKEVLLKIPVFAQLTEYELLTIADTLQEETFDDKSIICKQGDRGDTFYLVDEGVAICTQTENGKDVEVARLSSGTFFGEIALLTTKPRQATVMAEGNLKCFTLNRRTWNRVMGPLQDILMRNMDEYTKFRSLHI